MQFSVPTSLSVLNRRIGCAGRSGQHAIGILLAEPSVFQVVKKRKKPEEEKKEKTRKGDPVPNTLSAIKDELSDDEYLDSDIMQEPVQDDDEAQVERKKKMESGLQAWCLAEGCRVEVSDEYFNNPPRSSGMSTSMLFIVSH